MKCEDCGTKLNSGVCSNCHEELYIIENQSEYITAPLSQPFLDKADEQKKQVKANKDKQAKHNKERIQE
jgi:hypothetical protein